MSAEQPKRTRALVLLVLAVVAILGSLCILAARFVAEKNAADGAWQATRDLKAALDGYAREHGGPYPDGDHFRTLTASPSRRGAVPAAAGGWHYVEGLTLDDDPDLALAWSEKSYTAGELHRARYVILLGKEFGPHAVPDTEWPAFLKRQQELLARRARPAGGGGTPAAR
jgi:hypothetical protein